MKKLKLLLTEMNELLYKRNQDNIKVYINKMDNKYWDISKEEEHEYNSYRYDDERGMYYYHRGTKLDQGKCYKYKVEIENERVQQHFRTVKNLMIYLSNLNKALRDNDEYLPLYADMGVYGL